jgi:hypothetical protein
MLTPITRSTSLKDILEPKPNTSIPLEAANMSGTSNVGGRGVYEAGDQRNMKDSEIKDAERYKEGQPNSHLANDSST